MNTAFSIFYNSFFDFQPGHLNPHSNSLFKKFHKILPEIKWYLLSEADWLQIKLKKELDEMIKLYYLSGIQNPKFIDFLNGIYTELIYKENANEKVATDLWKNEKIAKSVTRIPNMLHEESYQYYKWLGRNHRGHGAIVELGCWMGAATVCLVEGLLENKNETKKEVFVFDSFKWSQSMLMFQNYKALKNDDLKEGDSFLIFFKKYCKKYLEFINISECYLYKHDETDRTLPDLTWYDSGIEILIFDFSSSREINDLIWKKFSPFFIPGVSILVFNQFGNLSANDVRQFIRDHTRNLKTVHKPNSAIKSYLYIE